MSLNKKETKMYNWLMSKPGYLKKSWIAAYDLCPSDIAFLSDKTPFEKAFKQARRDYKLGSKIVTPKVSKSILKVIKTPLKDVFPWNKDSKEKINVITNIKKFGTEYHPKDVAFKKPFKLDKSNVIILGDTHFPFEKEGYLDFCLDTQKKYNAGTVIHIGDVADNCYSSFHDNNPDGLAAGDELSYAIKSAKQWGKAFPHVKVTLGNHCQIIQRKAFASGVSSKWIKGLNEVLELPGWNFEMEFEIDGVLYTHGTGTSGDKAAYNKALHRRKSIVQGHLHSQASIMWNTSNIDKIFAMQVGCGVDETKYAFDYAKNFSKKFIISCGLVLENGQLPIIELMKL